MIKTFFALIGLASLVAGCAAASPVASGAQSCAQSGGTWRPTLAACERSSGGGGGY